MPKLALPPPAHMRAALTLQIQTALHQHQQQQQQQEQPKSQQPSPSHNTPSGTADSASASFSDLPQPGSYPNPDPSVKPGLIPPATHLPVPAELLHRLAVSAVALQLHGHGLWQAIGEHLLPHVTASSPDQLCITLHAMSVCRYHHVALFQAAAPVLTASCTELAAVSLGRALHAYSSVHHHDHAMCTALAAEVHDRVVGLTHRSLFSLLSRVGLGPGPTVKRMYGSLKVRDTASGAGGLEAAGGLAGRASREFLLLDLCRIIWALVKAESKDALLLDALSSDVSAQLLQTLSTPPFPHFKLPAAPRPPSPSASSTHTATPTSDNASRSAEAKNPRDQQQQMWQQGQRQQGQRQQQQQQQGPSHMSLHFSASEPAQSRAQPLLRDTVLAVLPRLTSPLQPAALLQMLTAFKAVGLDNTEVYTTLAATLHPWLDSLTLQQLGEAAACFASSPTPQQSLMLSPEAVGRLAWSLGMLGCVDHGVLEAVATTALMNSNRFTLQQLAEVLWCFGVCNYSPEDGAVVRHLYLQASERDIPSMHDPHVELLCQVHILLASGWQGFPFGEDLARLNASGWANKLSSVWDGVLRGGGGPAAMRRSVIGDEVAQALQMGIAGAAARPRATESLHNGLFKLPVVLPARSLASVHIMALLVHDAASYSYSYSNPDPEAAFIADSMHGSVRATGGGESDQGAAADPFQGPEGDHVRDLAPRLMGPAIWYSRVLKLLGWAVVDIHAHMWPSGTNAVKGGGGFQPHRPSLLQLARRAFLESELSRR
ncbi:MAG: hypothetical protein WDW38_000410 [Sanguina aurantia]